MADLSRSPDSLPSDDDADVQPLGKPIDEARLARVVEQTLRPAFERDGLLGEGRGEGYQHHEILPATTQLLTREAIEADTVGSVLGALKAHVNLLSTYEWMKAKTLLVHEGTEAEAVRARVLDLLYGADALAERVRRFTEWAAPRKREDGANMSLNATVASYLLAASQSERYAFCKPSVYKAAARALLGEAVGYDAPAERVAHCTAFYRAVLPLLRDTHGLPVSDLMHVHIAFYVVQKYDNYPGWDEPVEEPLLTADQERALDGLWAAFESGYASAERGAKHLAMYRASRADAEERYAELCARADRGEDVTDAVLLGLLPYLDTQGNRARGAWVHPGGAVTRDVREWFEGAGWAQPGDWPAVAEAVLGFVRQCVEEPDDLEEAVAEFVGSGRGKGLQAGMLTPILSALRPDAFSLVNRKSVDLLRRVAGARHETDLASYPAANATSRGLLRVLGPRIEAAGLGADAAADVLDMMGHWLATEAPSEGGPLEDGEPGEELAMPLAAVFEDAAEAEWAFGLLRRTLRMFGVDGPGDPRVALTMPLHHGGRVLRLNFGGWLVLDFRGREHAWAGVTMVLRHSDAAGLPAGTSLGEGFAVKEGEDAFGHYHFPFAAVRPMDEALDAAYERTMRAVAERFARWQGTPYRPSHRASIEAAVYDDEAREALFRDGLPGGEVLDDEEPGGDGAVELQPTYSLADCAAETGLDAERLGRWVRAIERKGQAVLYGPPGTGKTYLAERLARHLVGGTDGFVETVQFHPAYAYEDFVEGIRPTAEDGQLRYPLVPGRLLRFCEAAAACEGPCVLVIDEINRANLARVFGELMYLLEYRGRGVVLASGRRFALPANVRLLGTMNTADRSIALVDHALRRRFAFVRLWPEYGVLRRYHRRAGTGFPVDALVRVLEELNAQIGDPHYAVGISYFLDERLGERVEDVWRMEIEPYLEEYFFDQPAKAEAFGWSHVAARLGRDGAALSDAPAEG